MLGQWPALRNVRRRQYDSLDIL